MKVDLKVMVALATVAMVGCSSKSSSSDTAGSGAESTDWWSNSGDDTTSGGSSGGEDDDWDGEDDGDDDDDFEGDEAFLWGELMGSAPGRTGEAGYEVIQGGAEQCVVFFQVAEVTSTASCSSCSETFTVQISDVESEATDGCSVVGLDPSTLDGSRMSFGVSGEAMFFEKDGSWVEGGEAWTEDGMLGWEIWLLDDFDGEGDDEEGEDDDE